MCSKFFCTFRYIVRQRVYIIYDAIIYSKRPLLRLRPLPSNNELSAAKAHSILHHHPALLHRHTLIFDRLLTFVVAFSILVFKTFLFRVCPSVLYMIADVIVRLLIVVKPYAFLYNPMDTVTDLLVLLFCVSLCIFTTSASDTDVTSLLFTYFLVLLLHFV